MNAAPSYILSLICERRCNGGSRGYLLVGTRLVISVTFLRGFCDYIEVLSCETDWFHRKSGLGCFKAGWPAPAVSGYFEGGAGVWVQGEDRV